MPIQQDRFLALLHEAELHRTSLRSLRSTLQQIYDSAVQAARRGDPEAIHNVISDLAVYMDTPLPSDTRMQLERYHFKKFGRTNERNRERLRRMREQAEQDSLGSWVKDPTISARIEQATKEVDEEYARAKIPNPRDLQGKVLRKNPIWDETLQTPTKQLPDESPITSQKVGQSALDKESLRRYNERMEKLGEPTLHAEVDESFDPTAPLGVLKDDQL
jgi:hypothetical protein